MRRLFVMAGAFCAAMVLGSIAYAQQPAAPPPFPTVGTPVTVEQAKKAVAAALAEAKTRPYLLAFAVVEPNGSLVYFEKMDGAPYGMTDIAIGKARTAALYARPTRVFFDLMEHGHTFAMTLGPGVVASIGGLPLLADGKLIGGIGVSGSVNPAFDEAAAQAGLDALK